MLRKHSGCKSACALKFQDFIYICKCVADVVFVTVLGVCPSEHITALKAACFYLKGKPKSKMVMVT